MQMAKYSRALNSSLKKKSATTVVCDYKNANVQTSSSSISLQYRKYEKEIKLSFLS